MKSEMYRRNSGVRGLARILVRGVVMEKDEAS
jgi:hypothetical protein